MKNYMPKRTLIASLRSIHASDDKGKKLNSISECAGISDILVVHKSGVLFEIV